MPIPIYGHTESIVSLGKGQAFIGGATENGFQKNIYFLGCSNRNCQFSVLNKKVSVPRDFFVAIAIPDQLSGCISSGKKLIFQITICICTFPLD